MLALRRMALISTALVAVAAGSAQAQVKLQFKFPENQEYRYQEKLLVDQVLTINGMEVPTKSEQTISSKTSIGAKRPDGSVPVTQTVERVKSDVEVAGMTFTFDSDDKGEAPAGEPPPLTQAREVVKALGGASYVIVIDKDGKVAAIEGAERAVPKADAIDPAAAQEIKKRFDAERLKKETTEQYTIFPDIFLRAGEPWERSETMDLGGGQTMTFQRQYEYLGKVEKDGRSLDKVGVKAKSVTYAMEANQQVMVPESKLNIESSDGTILFDGERGLIVESKATTRITGDLTLSIQGNELPSKLDLTLDTTTSLLPAAK